MAQNSNEKTVYYRVKMQHDEDTLVKLSHMQYDIFCKRNRFFRTVLAAAAVIVGITNFDAFWGILLTAYGCYLLTSTYSSANHTAHKIAKQLKDAGMPFPASEYLFEDKSMRIISLNDSEELEALPYSSVRSIGEDHEYFYIFRDEFGGYMIPKDALGDEKTGLFRAFISQKTGQLIANRASPAKRLMSWFRHREDEPYHL